MYGNEKLCSKRKHIHTYEHGWEWMKSDFSVEWNQKSIKSKIYDIDCVLSSVVSLFASYFIILLCWLLTHSMNPGRRKENHTNQSKVEQKIVWDFIETFKIYPKPRPRPLKKLNHTHV